MSRKKILHILHAVGGVEVSIRLILNNINSSVFESVIIHGNEDTSLPFKNDRDEPVKSYRTTLSRNINPVKDIKAFFVIYRIIKREKPHLIHAHSAKGGILAKITGHLIGVPVVHTPQAYSYLSAENPLKYNIFLKVEKILSRLNNKVLACSRSEMKRAIEEVGYKPENTLLFNNSIEPIEELTPLSIQKTWPDDYICSVGRPSYQKNIEFLVDVIREIKKSKPDIHLVLMGVGFHSPNLDKVQQKIKDFHLQKNITLLEWTKREDIFHIIKNSKLYLSTARYEGLPYSIIEALALQKACVVTDADGNRDLIQNNKNGFVIFDQNVQGFAEKTLFLLEDEGTRLKFEKDAFQRFEENFNIHNTIHILEKIYIENALHSDMEAKN